METIIQKLQRYAKEGPNSPILFDEVHTKGITYAQLDDLSGRVYAWLKSEGIGKEDFILINLPRGVLPIIAMVGVWRAGAAWVLVEDTYAPERIDYIRRDCGCKLELSSANWDEVMRMEPLAGYGETGFSALTVVTYVQVLIMMIFMGFTSAVEPVFSYHYGTGNIDMRKKVYRLSMTWCVVLGVSCMLLLFLFRRPIVRIFFSPETEFYRVASLGCLLTLPACLFVGVNTFGSGLFTAFSNGLVSGLLSFVRTFLVLTVCIFGMTALFGGTGLWSAWPTAELLCLGITVAVLVKYRERYQY
jgi:hypothetical protein